MLAAEIIRAIIPRPRRVNLAASLKLDTEVAAAVDEGMT